MTRSARASSMPAVVPAVRSRRPARIRSPIDRRSGTLKVAIVRRSSGRTLSKASCGMSVTQRSMVSNRSWSWSRIVPLSRRKPSTQPAPICRIGARRQHEPHPARCVAAVDDAFVEEQARRPSRDEAVQALLVDQALQRLAPRGSVLGVVEQGDGAVHAVDLARKDDSRVVVERSGRAGQPDADPRDEAVDDGRYGGGVRAADVAVAQDPSQRREGVHQRGNVRSDRRHVADPVDHELDGLREVGEEHRLDQRGQRGQSLRGVGGFDRRVRGRFLDRVAEAARGDEIDRELGLPGERPRSRGTCRSCQRPAGSGPSGCRGSRAGAASGSERGPSRFGGRGRSSSGRAPASCAAGGSAAQGRRRGARPGHRAASRP